MFEHENVLVKCLMFKFLDVFYVTPRTNFTDTSSDEVHVCGLAGNSAFVSFSPRYNKKNP